MGSIAEQEVLFSWQLSCGQFSAAGSGGTVAAQEQQYKQE